MKLSFHGGDRSVTGSCHLVEAAGRRILVDCGMFQGGRRLVEENADPFGFDPATIDTVLLTHAHLDHCGRLPLLVKRGFRGEIVTTPASRELARIVLLDAANLQEEEAARDARQARRRGEDAPGPLYTVLDALNTLDAFGRTTGYDEPMQLGNGLRATFVDAGHILGSASIVIDHGKPGDSPKVAFSGDIGNAGRPLLRDPHPPAGADVVVMETTYGNRRHKPLPPSVKELLDVIDATIRRGGNVVIPTFALERAQEILFFMREAVEEKRLPASLQVFLDSPMAISATEIFRRHPNAYGERVGALLREGIDPFHLPGLHFTRETAESKAINQVTSGAVIMAGSGMATGGRVLHHLKHNLWRHEASVILVGFAARGTLARQLVEGRESVDIFGEEIPVHASIHTINGFSAHADRDELLAWHRAVRPEKTFLVHGEEDVMQRFARELRAGDVVMPRMGDRVEI